MKNMDQSMWRSRDEKTTSRSLGAVFAQYAECSWYHIMGIHSAYPTKEPIREQDHLFGEYESFLIL